MPDTIPGTDSAVDTTTPQGTVDAPNDQTGANGDGAGAAASPQDGFDEEFLSRLDSLEADKIPATLKNFNERFVPKAEFTKKTQALADERRALEAERKTIFDVTRRVLAERDTPKGPTPQETRKAELLELASAGDKDALREVIRMEAQEIAGPGQEQAAIRQAADVARASDPAVVQHWNEIVQTLNTDPALKELASYGNHKYADKVMLALGLEHKTRDQALLIQQRDADIAALKGKLSQYEKERVAGLPASTTRAGTSAGRPAVGDADEILDAGKRAWIEAGGRPDDYR